MASLCNRFPNPLCDSFFASSAGTVTLPWILVWQSCRGDQRGTLARESCLCCLCMIVSVARERERGGCLVMLHCKPSPPTHPPYQRQCGEKWRNFYCKVPLFLSAKSTRVGTVLQWSSPSSITRHPLPIVAIVQQGRERQYGGILQSPLPLHNHEHGDWEWGMSCDGTSLPLSQDTLHSSHPPCLQAHRD